MDTHNDQNEKSDINLDDIEKNNVSDWGAMIARGTFGAIPIVGPLFSEVITQLIPNQRQERIAKLLYILSKDFEKLNHQELILKLQDPYHIDIFEDACFQAARAVSDERLEYIASALKNGLTDNELEHTYKKKLLWLLGQLNDNEVLILYSYSSIDPYKNKEFFEKHKDSVGIKPKYMGMSEKEYEKATIHNSFRNRLVELNLLHPKFKKPNKGENPTFDLDTGMIESNGYTITPLGRALCNFINIETISKD